MTENNKKFILFESEGADSDAFQVVRFEGREDERVDLVVRPDAERTRLDHRHRELRPRPYRPVLGGFTIGDIWGG